MRGGYVKLYRAVVDKGWLSNPVLWTFWTYCLLKASYKETTVIVGNQQVKLLAGQFVFGRQKASKEIGLSERQIRTCCEVLKNMGNLTIKTTNKFSIITVVNWDSYQGREEENDHQNDQQHANNMPHIRSKKVLLSPSNNGDCPHQQIISLYHELLPMCPTVKEWTDARMKNLRARWKSSHEFQSLDWWRGFFEYIAKSKFLTGQVTGRNGKTFLVSLPWIVLPENFAKIREGMYE